MSKNFINLIKLCVGAENVSDLYNWQKNRIIPKKIGNTKSSATFLVTRMRPKRETEILNGGSIFWVFRGLILARQKILGIDKYIEEDSVLRCKIILDREIILTEPHQKKPFQGWRYLNQKDTPKDREIFSNTKTQLPLKIEKELSLIGIL